MSESVEAKLLAGRTRRSELLGSLTAGAMYDGLPLGVDSRLVLDKPSRDRLVIRDPRCAALVRRALAAEDVRAWHAEAARFLIALPDGWTAATFGPDLDETTAWMRVSDHYPALAKQLAPHADALQLQPHGQHWWELPPYSVERFAVQAIVWTHKSGLQVAPMLTNACLLDGITFTTAPTAYLLGVLGSATLRWVAHAAGGVDAERAAQLPIPHASAEAQEHVGALAELLVEHASARVLLERTVINRILHDLAPIGATAGPVLARWWALDFAGLLAELTQRFRSDLPLRYRETWQEWHATQRLAHTGHDDAIVRFQAELDEYVERLFGFQIDDNQHVQPPGGARDRIA